MLPPIQYGVSFSVAPFLEDSDVMLAYRHGDSMNDNKHRSTTDCSASYVVPSQGGSAAAVAGQPSDLHGGRASCRRAEAGNEDPKVPSSAGSRKRKASSISENERERKARAHRKLSQARLERRIAENSLQVITNLSFSGLPTSTSGASGSRSKSRTAEIDLLLASPLSENMELRQFRVIPYKPQSVVQIYSEDAVLVYVRTFRHRAMNAARMGGFMRSLNRLATACNIKQPAKPHPRGDFAQLIIGQSHGMGEGENFPYRLNAHKQHHKPIQDFLDSEPVKFALKTGNELLNTYFPKFAQFCRDLNKFWKEKTDGAAAMDFGHFYTMAINFPVATEVKAIAHVDRMNLAFGPCAIMPFGFFPSHVRAWFVNHSFKCISQVPTAVWTYTYSGLGIHYNSDTQEFMVGGFLAELVTTNDYELPNEFNTTPLQTLGTGRGSIVLYNQASFAHWFITGERYMPDAERVHGGVEGVRELFATKAKEVLQYRH